MTAEAKASEDHFRRGTTETYLSRLFGELDEQTLRDIEPYVKWVSLPSGKELFRKGDPPDGAYILALGRLRVAIETRDGTERVIDEVAPGEWIGEMALLTKNPRSATIYAARDSELVWISNEAWDELSMRFPRVLLETSRVLVTRLLRHMEGRAHVRDANQTFAVIPVDESVDIQWFVNELSLGLAKHGSLLRLSPERVDGQLGKSIANSKFDDPSSVQLAAWLIEQERAHDFVVYEASAQTSEWTDRTIRHADHVLLVADGSSSTRLRDVERKLTAKDASTRMPHASLVLLQRGTEHSYSGTSAWLEPRRLNGHYHVHKGRVSDVERLARILSNNAVGVVFGGGASRGYAHIGVVRALEEAKIPVDYVGGSSIGAVIALSVAADLDSKEILKIVPPLMRKAFFDPTLPVVSLMRGKNTLEAVRSAVGGPRNIEDFVRPLFAVSTSLTRGEAVVHRSGPVDILLRASGSVPGIFPPVPYEGELLVDGGLANNVPADVMMSLIGPRVIAIDVMPEFDVEVGGEKPASLSGWTAAWRALNPWGKEVGVPNLLSTLMRSAMMSARGLRSVDPATYPHLLYLRPPVSRWNLMDFSNAAPVAEEGYRATAKAIKDWWAREKPARA
jgi:predicted acylesterase/phospholipase RssA/CRP-like cAMP-binding protein